MLPAPPLYVLPPWSQIPHCRDARRQRADSLFTVSRLCDLGIHLLENISRDLSDDARIVDHQTSLHFSFLLSKQLVRMNSGMSRSMCSAVCADGLMQSTAPDIIRRLQAITPPRHAHVNSMVRVNTDRYGKPIRIGVIVTWSHS